ncbi:MAG: RICIN domain-containing protein [Myxococcales bacterium]
MATPSVALQWWFLTCPLCHGCGFPDYRLTQDPCELSAAPGCDAGASTDGGGAAAGTVASSGQGGETQAGASSGGPSEEPGALVGTYQLIAAHSSKCMAASGALTAAANVSLQQLTCAKGDRDQIFDFRDAGDGYYSIAVSGSQECVAVEGDAIENRALLVRLQCSDTKSQKWLAVPQHDGGVILINALSSKCADVGGKLPDDGTPIQQYVCNGADNQRWSLLPIVP